MAKRKQNNSAASGLHSKILEAVAETTEASLVYLDRDFNFVWTNQTYADACARTKEELIGRNHFELYPHEENEAIFARVRDTGEPFQIKEKPFVFPDHPEWGVTYWDWTLTPIRDSEGQVQGLVFSLVDVTARKQVQEDLRIAHVELQERSQEVESANEELASVNEELKATFEQLETANDDLAGANTEMRVTNDQLRAANDALEKQVSERREAEQALQRSIDRFALLSETAGQLLVTDDPQRLVDALCHKVMDHLDCHVFFHYLVDENAGCLHLNAYAGIPGDIGKSVEQLEYGAAVCGCVAREGCRIVAERIPETSDVGTELVKSFGIKAYACHPLLSEGGRVIGTLSFGTRSRISFTEDELAVMKTVADQVATAMERKRSREAIAVAKADAERRAAELESFISSMSDGVALVDAQGRAVLFNEASRNILGQDPLKDLADRVRQFDTYKLDGTRMSVEDTASYRALQGEMVKDMHYSLRYRDGEEIVMSVSASPVRGSDGRVVGAAVVFRDVTDRVEFEHRQQELYEREHHIAEMLQQSLVPPRLPSLAGGCRIAAAYQPALKEAEIGGDFYDVFELGQNRLGVLIGDVAGKGLKGAVRVAAARHAIRSYAYLEPSPGTVMTLANEALCRDEQGGGILTAFFAVVDADSGTITYSSAGHEPPVICDGTGGFEELAPTGMALGVLTGIEYGEVSRRLDRGHRVVMLTDGITEAGPSRRNLFAKEGVLDYLASSRAVSAEDLVVGLLAAAKDHSGGHLLDDAAIVVLEPAEEGSACVEPAGEPADLSAVCKTAVINARGPLDWSTSHNLSERIGRAVNACERVTVDLTAVTFIDTGVLDCLARAAKTMLESEHRLRVVVREGSHPLCVLRIVGFGDLIDLMVRPPTALEEPWTALEEQSMVLTSRPYDLAVCREAVRNAARTVGFSGEPLWGIVSAVFEACANALGHGSQGACGPVTVSVHAYSDRFEAVVKDSGKGFVCPADTPLPPVTSSRGRGIPLMRLFMDEVRFESDGGCRVTLVKRLR